MKKNIGSIDYELIVDEKEFYEDKPFMNCKIKVLYVGKNRNGSYFSKAVIEEMAKKIYYTPIVGFFSESEKDFLGHEDTIITNSDGEMALVPKTIPFGVIPEYPNASWITEDGKEYLLIQGLLWTKRYKEYLKDFLNGQSKKQSMELFEDSIKGFWAKDLDSDEPLFIFEEAEISAFCILGDKREPCYEGSNIELFELKQENFKQDFNQMLYEIKEYNQNKEFEEEGGKILKKAKKAVEKAKETCLQADIDAATKLVEALEDEELKKELLDELKKIKVKDESTDNFEAEEEVNEEEQAAEEDEADGDGESDEKTESELLTEKEIIISKLEKEVADISEEMKGLIDKLHGYELKEKQAVLDKFKPMGEEVIKDFEAKLSDYSTDALEKELSFLAFKKGLSLENFEVRDKQVITFESKKSVGNSIKPAWIEAIEKQNIN